MSDKYLGDNLIFIISQPRSGSTLLQRMLSGHPDIASSAETWLMLHPVYGDREEGIETEYGAHWARLARNEFLENYTEGMTVYEDACRAWARTFYDNALQTSGGKIFIDKTPRYAMIIPELFRLFPQAKFVFLLRNPMAILASELNSFVKDQFNILSEFRSDLLEAPQQILDGIAQHDAAIVVRYEELVSDSEAQVRALSDKLGIDYVPEMLDYSGTPEAKGFMTDRVGIQKQNKPVTDSINKWKSMLDDPQQLHFAQSYLAALGKDIVEALGYDYASLDAELKSAGAPTGVYPWRLAINPIDGMSLRDRYTIRRFKRSREDGRIVGRVGAFFDLLRQVGREIATWFSKS